MSGARQARAARAVRAAAAIGVLLGAALLGAAPAAPAWAAPGESITGYDTRMEVRADGTTRITETIAYDFGGNSRHGILRTIPVRFRYDDTHDRLYPIDALTVSRDGTAEPSTQDTSSGTLTIKIGDPNRTLTGSHSYVIGYTVRGALNHFTGHEELYWNAVGDQWQVPVSGATVTVTGPAAITQVACFAGPGNSHLACGQSTKDGPNATFDAGDLGAGSSLTVVVAFPAGSVANTTPILAEHRDLATAFATTAGTIGGAAGLALIGTGAALAVAWRVGRDRRYIGQLPGLVPGIGQSTTEEIKPLTGAPPVSVEFVPPDGIRPGQVGTLIDEKADVVDVTATIIDFAVRRHLHIREVPGSGKYGSKDWELTKLDPGDPKFVPYERELFDALFRDRDTVLLSELKYHFTTDLALVWGRLYADMVAQGWYRRSPRATRAMARGIAFVIVLGAVGVTVLLALLTHLALLGLGLVAGALVLLAVAGRFPARTGRGSAVLARVQGFRLYVATAEAEQLKFQEREEIFSRYLPYAIVFGLADRWAGIFASVGVGAPGSTGTGGLYWYSGLPGWSLLYFPQSIGSFATTTTGSIAMATPSASGSSGFSGGFSGGGGGGGGGGSW